MAPVSIATVTPDSSDASFPITLSRWLHVASPPLAVFLFIVILIVCLVTSICLVCCIRSFIRTVTVTRKKRNILPGIYLDELPDVKHNESASPFGSLEYSLAYNVEKEELRIGVMRANNLATRPGVEFVDPYVLIFLLYGQDGHIKSYGSSQKTSVERHCNRPTWNAHVDYKIKASKLKHITIVFHVYDYDAAGTDVGIGRLEVTLKSLDCSEYIGHKVEITDILQAGSSWKSTVGEICLGLQFQPTEKRLDVTILEARSLVFGSGFNMKVPMIHFKVNAIYKSYFLGSQRTDSKKATENPYLNEKFRFPIRPDQLNEASVTCELRKRGRFGAHHRCGRIRVGAGSEVSTGTKHWEEMIKRAPRMAVMWHSLLE